MEAADNHCRMLNICDSGAYTSQARKILIQPLWFRTNVKKVPLLTPLFHYEFSLMRTTPIFLFRNWVLVSNPSTRLRAVLYFKIRSFRTLYTENVFLNRMRSFTFSLRTVCRTVSVGTFCSRDSRRSRRSLMFDIRAVSGPLQRICSLTNSVVRFLATQLAC